jgi:hypothetical protein
VAYPIITDVYRLQWSWQNLNTGLPEDQYVNNFYFRNDFINGSPQEIHDAMQAAVEGFYTTLDPVGGNILGFLSAEIGNATVKSYDLGQAAPRYPIVPPTTSTIIPSGGSQLPRETALVCSFSSGNGPRAKGRVYLGPLGGNTLDATGDAPRPSSNFMAAVAAGAENLLATSENVTWVTVSPTAGTSGVVTDGWVDNAWDTQRSRGAAPTMRIDWPRP